MRFTTYMQFTVGGGRVIPEAHIRQTALLTNCDPEKSNAELTASVSSDPNNQSSYVFGWSAGSSVSTLRFYRTYL